METQKPVSEYIQELDQYKNLMQSIASVIGIDGTPADTVRQLIDEVLDDTNAQANLFWIFADILHEKGIRNHPSYAEVVEG